MITIRHERSTDIGAREALLDRAYGAARFAKASERLREGRLPADGLSFVATEGGRIVGTVRLWHVARRAWPSSALLLGPLAVAAGLPQARHRRSADAARDAGRARMRGHGAVLLVGDAPYYGRFGFSAEKTGASVRCPGRIEQHRLLGARTQAPARSTAPAA